MCGDFCWVPNAGLPFHCILTTVSQRDFENSGLVILADDCSLYQLRPNVGGYFYIRRVVGDGASLSQKAVTLTHRLLQLELEPIGAAPLHVTGKIGAGLALFRH